MSKREIDITGLVGGACGAEPPGVPPLPVVDENGVEGKVLNHTKEQLVRGQSNQGRGIPEAQVIFQRDDTGKLGYRHPLQVRIR